MIAFFVLACALAWFGNIGNWFWPPDAWPRPMMPLGPLIAAPIVIWLTEGRAAPKAWFWRVLKFRTPVWVYLLSFFVPLAIITSSVSLAIAIGTPTVALPVLAPLDYVIFIPIIMLFGPLPEELSFRGYGQHDLQRVISPLAASLCIGLGVLVWHLPLLVGGFIPWPLVLTLLAVSAVYAWFYIVGGSVWPLVILHFVQNYFGGGYFGEIFAEKDGPVWIDFLTAFYVAWALFLVWRFGPTLGRRESAA